jgi:hypothetical protein
MLSDFARYSGWPGRVRVDLIEKFGLFGEVPGALSIAHRVEKIGWKEDSFIVAEDDYDSLDKAIHGG